MNNLQKLPPSRQGMNPLAQIVEAPAGLNS